MEVKDKLKPYLGTKTILIIDSEEDWLQIYDKLKNNLIQNLQKMFIIVIINKIVYLYFLKKKVLKQEEI